MSRSPYIIDMRPKPGRVRRPEEVLPAAKKKPAKPKNKRRFGWKSVLIHLLKATLLLAAAYGFLSLGISLAERLIGIYFVASIIYAIGSQRTFLVALIFLVMVAVWSGIGKTVPAENYAIYAFYFLVIGLVSAIREMLSTNHESASVKSQE